MDLMTRPRGCWGLSIKNDEYTYILLVPWNGFKRMTRSVSIISGSLGKNVGALRFPFAIRSKTAR